MGTNGEVTAGALQETTAISRIGNTKAAIRRTMGLLRSKCLMSKSSDMQATRQLLSYEILPRFPRIAPTTVSTGGN
jgi:hypothetical protein